MSFTSLTSTVTHSLYFFFNDPATTEIYTLSLHDALPILRRRSRAPSRTRSARPGTGGTPSSESRPGRRHSVRCSRGRSEEHTSELQSRRDLVCRLLLEKKKKKKNYNLALRYI